MNFGMITLNQSIEMEQNYVTDMDTDSFVIYIKTENFYKDIADDVEEWFDTSALDQNDKRPLPIGKNKKVPKITGKTPPDRNTKDLEIILPLKYLSNFWRNAINQS